MEYGAPVGRDVQLPSASRRSWIPARSWLGKRSPEGTSSAPASSSTRRPVSGAHRDEDVSPAEAYRAVGEGSELLAEGQVLERQVAA
jgi:hypothetical protein